MRQRTAATQLRALPLLAIPALAVLVACRHLTTDFHKDIDGDMAFFLDRVRRGGPTCCYHPLLDYPLAIYRALAALTGDHLLALQLFFLSFLLLATSLYGIVFHRLFRSLSLSLLAAATYPMVPLVQNLLAHFEDNLVKLPLLLGVLALVLGHEAGARPWRPYLAIALFVFTCLVALDALTWAPFVAGLILWRHVTATDRFRRLAPFCGTCLLVAMTSLFLLAWSHDLAYPPVARPTTLGAFARSVQATLSLVSGPARPPGSPSPARRRVQEFLLEPLEPLFGLEHIALAPRTAASATRMGGFVERLRQRPGLANVTTGFLAAHVLLFGLALWHAGRGRDPRRFFFVAIVFLNFALQFAVNFAVPDRPNERYDHYVLQLPFILASYRGMLDGLRARAAAGAIGASVLAGFVVIGLAHHARSPYRLSQLYRLQAAFPGPHAEYYFSLRELPSGKAAEAAFLAGYVPLRIVNVDARHLGVFAPGGAFMDRRPLAAVREHLRARGSSAYVSPGLRAYVGERGG
jgi:hypothetical protein